MVNNKDAPWWRVTGAEGQRDGASRVTEQVVWKVMAQVSAARHALPSTLWQIHRKLSRRKVDCLEHASG